MGSITIYEFLRKCSCNIDDYICFDKFELIPPQENDIGEPQFNCANDAGDFKNDNSFRPNKSFEFTIDTALSTEVILWKFKFWTFFFKLDDLEYWFYFVKFILIYFYPCLHE